MKPTILLLFALAFAQLQQSKAQFLASYGLKFAVTSASQNITYAYTPPNVQLIPLDRRIGFNAALFAESGKISWFSLVGQLEYAQRGFTQSFSYYSQQLLHLDERNLRIDYLSVPVLVKISPTQWPLSPFVIAGPRLDIRVGGNDNMLGASWIENNFRKATWGATAGVGVQTQALLPVGVLLEMRYNVDAMYVSDQPTVKVRNNSFDVWLGLAF